MTTVWNENRIRLNKQLHKEQREVFSFTPNTEDFETFEEDTFESEVESEPEYYESDSDNESEQFEWEQSSESDYESSESEYESYRESYREEPNNSGFGMINWILISLPVGYYVYNYHFEKCKEILDKMHENLQKNK